MPTHTEQELQQMFDDFGLGTSHERESFLFQLFQGDSSKALVNFTRVAGTTENGPALEGEENA